MKPRCPKCKHWHKGETFGLISGCMGLCDKRSTKKRTEYTPPSFGCKKWESKERNEDGNELERR